MGVSASEKQQIIKAIDELKHKVMVADVVARTGLPFDQVASAMNTIAAETYARLDVTQSGEILYHYPHNFYYAYFARGVRRVFQNVAGILSSVGYTAFKLSFGIILIGSLFFISGLILLIQTVLGVWQSNTESVFRMWRDFVLLFYNFARNHIFVRHSIDPGSGSGRSNILYSCYSFLFGEKNPNADIEEQRSQLIAQTIRLNEGVILPEHLSPYLSRMPGETEMFDAMARYDGYPSVTDNGTILYVFPNMRSRSEVASYAFLPPVLEQQQLIFSHLSKDERKKLILITICELLGLVTLTPFVWVMSAAHHAPFPLWYVVLQSYCVLFLVIPCIRAVWVYLANRRIQTSNARAHEFERELGNPSETLATKLEEAERFRRDEPQVRKNNVIYTTARDFVEQSIERDAK